MVNDELFRRRWLVISLTFAVVVVFIFRLFFLQLISSDYKQRAENNAYYVLSTIPSRGVIFDRNGQLLVANRPIFDLMIVNNEAKGKLDTTLLSEILRIPREELVAKLSAVLCVIDRLTEATHPILHRFCSLSWSLRTLVVSRSSCISSQASLFARGRSASIITMVQHTC